MEGNTYNVQSLTLHTHTYTHHNKHMMNTNKNKKRKIIIQSEGNKFELIINKLYKRLFK